jgi:hypothetical protein
MRLFGKRDELSEVARELRANRPEPRREFISALEQRVRADRYRRRPAYRWALTGALTAALLVALAAFGGLGYAASTASHVARAATHLVKPRATHTAASPTDLSSAAAQYGKKVKICTVEPNGKQHTITISQNAAASYLARHPRAYRGSCGAARPRGAKRNVCVKVGKRLVPVWVPPSKQRAYLHRNKGSHRTRNGKC